MKAALPVTIRRTSSAIVLTTILLLAVGYVTTTPAAHPANAAGFLDPSVLVVYDGSMTVTEDGAVIENLEIRGTLRIKANNVVVRNVWVYTTAPWTVYVASGSATFENVEIGNTSVIGERGIGGANIVARNLDIHSVEDGIKLGSNSVYDNVRVHDLNSLNPDPHSDAVQADGGAQNSTIKNSSLSSTGPREIGNAAVFLKSDLGSISNITISNSYLNGGNYMNAVRDGGNGAPTGVRFINNRIGDNYRYGTTRFDGPVEWSGNVWASNGEPAEPGADGGSTTTTTTTTTAPPPTTTTTKAPPATTTTTTTKAPPATTTTTTTKAPPATTTTTTVSPTTTSTGALSAPTTSTVPGLIVPSSEDPGTPDPTTDSIDSGDYYAQDGDSLSEVPSEAWLTSGPDTGDSDGVNGVRLVVSALGLVVLFGYFTVRMSQLD